MNLESAGDYFITGGTLPPDAPCYVTRSADRALLDGLRSGEFCYVLTSRQMGKSSLMVRAAARIKASGDAVAVVDLTAIGRNVTIEQWYGGLVRSVGRQLGLEDETEDFWNDHLEMGPVERWLSSLSEVLLKWRPSKITIFIDEIDVVRSLPFSTDEFFAAIRECYNRRAREPEFKRITFCLLGVVMPSDLIRDTRTTPFNIGKRIELTDFTPQEALPLADGLISHFGAAHDHKSSSSPPGSLPVALLERIHYWTGGHPYLTQSLCAAVAERVPNQPAGVHRVDEECQSLFLSTAARVRDDNLIFVRDRLLRSEEDQTKQLALYERVLRGKLVADDEANSYISLLKLSGIVRVANGVLKVRNRIYARAFDQSWVHDNLPDAELRRQQAAYRRGMLRAVSVSSGIILVFACLAAYAVRQKGLSDLNARRATAREVEAETAKTQAQTAAAAAKKDRDKAIAAQSEANRARRLANINAARADKQRDSARRLEVKERLARLGEAQQRKLAVREAENRRLALYDAQTSQAQREINARHFARAIELLASHIPRAGQSDLREFTWRHLWEQARDRSVKTFSGFASFVMNVAFSQDGKWMATADHSGAVKLWSMPHGTLIHVFRGHRQNVDTVAFSPDGQLLATGSLDKTVKIWDLAARREICAVTQFNGNCRTVRFSPDGNILAIGSWDGSVRLWDRATRQADRVLRPGDYVMATAFSPDGKRLYTCARVGCIQCWSLETLKVIREWDGGSYIWSLALNSDGSTLATGHRDGEIKIWDAATGTARGVFNGHVGLVLCLAYSPNRKLLASSSFDATIRLWSVPQMRELAVLTGHQWAVEGFAFSPDGKFIASGSKDKSVKIWNARESDVTPNDTLKEGDYRVLSDGLSKAAWSDATSNVIHVRDLHNGTERYLRDGNNTVEASYFDGNGRLIGYSRSYPPGESTAKRFLYALEWDPVSSRILRRIQLDAGSEWTTFLSGPNLIATAASGGILTFREPGANRVVGRIPLGYAAAKMYHDWGSVRIDSKDGKIHLIFPLISGRAAVVRFSPPDRWQYSVLDFRTGKESAAASLLGTDCWIYKNPRLESFILRLQTLRRMRDAPFLWRPSRPSEMIELRGHYDQVWDAGFSRDGKRIITCGADQTARLWDAATGRIIGTLRGHAGWVTGGDITPDGKTIVTVSDDQTIRLWNAATLEELASFPLTTGVSEGPVFRNDGRTLTLIDKDRKVHVWRAPPPAFPQTPLSTVVASDRTKLVAPPLKVKADSSSIR